MCWPNSPSSPRAVLPPDKPQELVCLVRRTGVSIMHEGKPLLEWTGNPNRFAIRPDLQSPGGRISLTSWNSRFRIEKLELAPTPATSLPAVLPLGMDGKVISMIRPERDARKGDWVLDGDSLTCKLYSQSRLLIPAMVPSRYVFSGTATRKKGMLDLLIGLVVDGHPCSIPLDGGDGAGLDLLDGATFWEGSNILHRKYPGRLLPHNKPTSFRCFVLPDAIIVECAGKEVVRWHGDARRLSARAQFVPPNYSEPDRKHLWIGGYESEFTFRDLELKPLSDADADRISKSFSGVYPTGPQVTVPLKSLTP